jgi:putative sterol carrier protein
MQHAPPESTRTESTHDDCRLFWEAHVPRLLERGRDTTLPGLTAIVRFELGGPGGGAWTVTIERGRIECVERGAPAAATAVIALDAADFAAIARGSLDHREAFFANRIRLEGDVGLVLWAANLIPYLREKFPFEPEKLRGEP